MSLHKRRPTDAALWDETRFCRPETVLLDGLRLWSQNPQNLAHIRRLIAAEAGPDAAVRAVKALKLLAHLIGLHARRTFALHHPGAAAATADERAFLALIGAALHGRRAQAAAIAAWLVPTPCHGTVLALAGELGRALRMGGLEIPPPRQAKARIAEPVPLRAVVA